MDATTESSVPEPTLLSQHAAEALATLIEERDALLIQTQLNDRAIKVLEAKLETVRRERELAKSFLPHEQLDNYFTALGAPK